MDTDNDAVEKHRELIEYLMLGHMSSFSVNTHLISILGYSEMLFKEAVGPLNEEQKHFLSIINNNIRYLHKHINVFITASRLIFKPQQLYLTKFSLAETIDGFVKRIASNIGFQIDKDIPDNMHAVEGDANLIGYAFASIEGIVMQIHPAGKGDVKIAVKENGKSLKFIVSTNKEMFVDLGEENIDLFVVQFVAELHNSSFEVEYDSNDRCKMTFTLPTKND